MRLHEAAPKLIIQERLGDKVKVSSYWPVPELTRARVALGWLQISPISHILLSLERQKMQSKSPKPFTILLSNLYYLVPFNFTSKRQV